MYTIYSPVPVDMCTMLTEGGLVVNDNFLVPKYDARRSCAQFSDCGCLDSYTNYENSADTFPV